MCSYKVEVRGDRIDGSTYSRSNKCITCSTLAFRKSGGISTLRPILRLPSLIVSFSCLEEGSFIASLARAIRS